MNLYIDSNGEIDFPSKNFTPDAHRDTGNLAHEIRSLAIFMPCMPRPISNCAARVKPSLRKCHDSPKRVAQVDLPDEKRWDTYCYRRPSRTAMASNARALSIETCGNVQFGEDFP